MAGGNPERSGSALEGLIIPCEAATPGQGLNLRQDRVVILIAIATDQFLMGAEGGYPCSNFFANIIAKIGAKIGAKGRRAGGGMGLGQRGRRGFDERLPGRRFRCRRFSCRRFSCKRFAEAMAVRLLSTDGLRKRHGFRDQKVSLLLPAHDVPHPAFISAKSR